LLLSQVPLVAATKRQAQNISKPSISFLKIGNLVQTSTCGMFEEALNFVKRCGMVVEDLPKSRSLSRFADRWGFVVFGLCHKVYILSNSP